MKKTALAVKIACLSAAVSAVTLLLVIVKKCAFRKTKELKSHE